MSEDPPTGDGPNGDAGGEEERGIDGSGERGVEDDEDRTVERSFTCALCGFPMTYEVAPLVATVSGVCHNCGDWTTQTADREVLAAAARDAASALAGELLTERQALAYVLREELGADRATAAEVMDSSESNVDNLHRRASEKLADAERIVETLDALTGDGDEPSGDRADGDDS